MAGPTDIRDVVAGLGERALRRGHIGLVVGVIGGEDELVCGFGRARDDSRAEPDERTIFELGSITKVFTGVLLARLATDGVLGLDDRLEQHLPPGASAPRSERPITLADLGSHSAGLPREPTGTLRTVLRRPLHPYETLLDVYAARAVDDVHASLGRIRMRPRRVRYSNLGGGLLGNVLAARLGATYEDAVRRQVCLPLGLEDTFVDVPDEAEGRLAHGHTRRGRPRPPFENPALAGAGSLRSTAWDMLRFLRANVDPPAGSLGAALQLAQQPRSRMRGGVEVGLGWLIAPVRRRSERKMHWHNGGTGGFRTFAAFVGATGTGVVVLGNTNRSVDLVGLRLIAALDKTAA